MKRIEIKLPELPDHVWERIKKAAGNSMDYPLKYPIKKQSRLPAIACVCLVVSLLTIVSAILYVMASSYDAYGYGGHSPIVQIDCTEDSNGDYHCKVIKISMNYDLEAYQYFLKDNTGLTKQFGEIGLQNISGDWHGVDVTWDDNAQADLIPGNHFADRHTNAGGAYTDPYQAQVRLDDVQTGYQGTKGNQKGEGTISVLFNDKDRNGKLTAGDEFLIRGNSRDHTANDDYKLEIKYDITDDTIGIFKLGA